MRRKLGSGEERRDLRWLGLRLAEGCPWLLRRQEAWVCRAFGLPAWARLRYARRWRWVIGLGSGRIWLGRRLEGRLVEDGLYLEDGHHGRRFRWWRRGWLEGREPHEERVQEGGVGDVTTEAWAFVLASW
jgi:hypothetical protein